MVIFDRDITFETDDTAVIGAREIGGTRFKLCITRQYAQRTWRIRYSQAEVRTQIWLHIDEFREVVAREMANGKTELLL